VTRLAFHHDQLDTRLMLRRCGGGMNHLVFAATLLAVCTGVGAMLSRLLPAGQFRYRILAAPPFGLATLAIVVASAYRYGVAPHASVACLALVAAVCIARLAREFLTASRAIQQRVILILAASACVTIACLAPQWTGGPQFAAFQGNHYDHLTYLSSSVAFNQWPYAQLRSFLPSGNVLLNDFVLQASNTIDDRPAAMAIYAGFSGAAGFSTTEMSYTYLATLQAIMFFAASFMAANLFAARLPVVLVCAAGLAVGFSMQYVLDINAWSQLAAMPVAIVAFTLFLSMLNPREPVCSRVTHTRTAIVMGVAAGGLLFLYPEMSPIYMVAATASLATWAWCRRGCGAVRGTMPWIGVAVVVAMVLASIYPNSTFGQLSRQVSFAATDTANDWWRYFDLYLFGFDHELVTDATPWTWTRVATVAARLPLDIVTALIGLYFILPRQEIPLVVEIIWRAVLAAFLATLIISSVGAWRITRGKGDDRVALVATAALGVLGLAAAVALTGHYWAAGKFLSYDWPLLYVLLVAPILLPDVRWSMKIGAALLVGCYFAFGVARPIAASDVSGVHYASPPYPSSMDASLKLKYDWDLERRRADLWNCHAISVDIDNPALDQYFQTFLTEIDGTNWSSARPLRFALGIGPDLGTQAQVANPDCVVTSVPRAVAPHQALISLMRKR
jgi:hypothetical protein